ncbi:alpha-D-ribose 1-methylphosphonate 5-triphosphate diphosphatase [Marinibacterium profundimaris]|uniref:Phosphonate metabolism protein PhnM n=1 Tax=Marinibacterium profundimaris TaxID=1679460 RepID=A0A225NKJ4_9RHOB|nr:alpha-D-ribose 1-methylphosphonate 5-triphosphate diphosphatase [Marinibacterium profundimaris]OWU74725.1 phosphonate metabolism protein PhnM [Marinibacterium profundimaris]
MWLSNATLVGPDRVYSGALRIADGRIEEITEDPVEGVAVDCQGMLLTPGLIDMHGDMIEQELEPRPRVHFPTEVALNALDLRLAAAGVTTAYAAVSFTAGASQGQRRSFDHTSDVIRALGAAKDRLRIDHRVHARFDITFEDALSVVEALIEDGAVDLISLMDHTPGQGQYRDLERFAAQLAYSRGIDHEEAEQLVADKIVDRTRPAEVIATTLQEIAALCARSGVPMASHDDDTAEKVALMAGLGVRISEFPVSDEAAAACRDHGLVTAMGAPNALRGLSYSGNLSAREAHAAGYLDILAADYHPAALLPALLILAETDPNGLPGALAMATDTPARALGLSDRGRLEPGLRADLAIFDPASSGRCVAAWSAGRMVHFDGTLQMPLPL